MVEGLAPPTRAVVHSHDTICRRLRIQYVFLHMCGVNQFWIIVFFTAVKPANNILFCIELIQRPESSLRRHKLGLTDQSIRSNDDKTRFTCAHRLKEIILIQKANDAPFELVFFKIQILCNPRLSVIRITFKTGI